MKPIFIILSALVATPAMAEPLAYPGTAYATVSSPSTNDKESPEAGNWTFVGRVTQGVDWETFGKDDKWTLNTYVTLGLNFDLKGLDYNNRITPGVGVKVSRPVKNGIVEIGVQAIHETRFGNKFVIPNRSSAAVQGYISYWSGWGK
jgi:hypothetical protein